MQCVKYNVILLSEVTVLANFLFALVLQKEKQLRIIDVSGYNENLNEEASILPPVLERANRFFLFVFLV